MYLPLVSIIIPVYNGSDYVHEAIESALNQTYENIEVIVVNDGSNDNGLTENVVKSYDDKIRYFSKENGGVASALNVGILNMKGEYFSWLSHDDLYMPDKIEEQIKFINRENSFDSIIYSNYYLIDSFGNFILSSDLSNSYRFDFRIWLTVFSELNGCTLLIPSAAFKNSLFNEKLKHTQDYDLWFKFSSNYCFNFLPMYLVKSRQHEKQDSKKLSDEALIEVSFLKRSFVEKINYKTIFVYGGWINMFRIFRGITGLRTILNKKSLILLMFKILLSKIK